MKTIKEKDNRLLLGVTGGIACGKTTVTNILEELGAPLIDFDLIARQVVEPGTHALRKIVVYFGKQVLREDGALDRKKLSKIVFQDFEKKKILEGFTHPPIYKEFFKQVNKITEKDPAAVIQVVVPLLIELNLQYMFHKVLVVYIPEDQQIKRLIKRDGITKDEAANMLRAQLPSHKKVGYADFVVYNQGPVEETRKQVVDIWEELQRQSTGSR
jgi:dephospho-CoA kinase